MKYLLIISLFLVGCINLDFQTVPTNKEVPATIVSKTCAYWVLLPFMFGDLTIEKAIGDSGLTRLRHAQFTQWSMPFYGRSCLKVTGE